MKPQPRPAGSFRRARPTSAAAASRGRAGAGGWPPAWLWPALASGAVACALYFPALGYDFVRDDRELLLEGSRLRAEGTLAPLLASDYWAGAGGVSGLWRPLIVLTLWLDGRLSGWSPGWFHGANLLAHGLSTFLLVRVVAAYGGGPIAAWFAGLWFAVMPAHVESVAWIAGRTDLWCALLLLAGLALAQGTRRARGAAPAALALALLAKESAAAAAPALALAPLFACAPGAVRRVWWRTAAPSALVLVVWAVLHALLVRPMAASAGLEAMGARRLWTALAVPAWELRLLVPGAAHGPDWMLAPLASAAPAALLGLALQALALVLVVRLLGRRDALALPLALFWLPLAGMSALALASGTLFSGERHVYLASAGAAWAFGVELERRSQGRFVRPALLALASLVLVWCARDTLATLPAWRNDETMYAAMARTQPRNATAPLGQALAMMERGDQAGAWAALARAAAIDSTRYEIALYRAGILLRRGRPEEALALARLAGARAGWNRDARLIEALALQRLGRWTAARPTLADLSARAPGDPDVRSAWRVQLAGEARASDSTRAPPRP